MSEHQANIRWTNTSGGMNSDSYNREHQWDFLNGIKINASAAVEYKGKEDCVDPEQALVAAISSCHMLTFLAIASKKGMVVEKYSDDAVGFLEKDGDGTISLARAVLKPKIVFSGEKIPTQEDLERLHHSAHAHCFIANSVRTDVKIEL
ncbi:MAG: OsmC family protein [Candidatus Omnitrophota bacterium]